MRFKITCKNATAQIINDAGEIVLDYQLGDYKLDADIDGLIETGKAIATHVQQAVQQLENT